MSDPSKLQEEYTRYQFYLQIRRDILQGRLQLPASTACLIASYTVQCKSQIVYVTRSKKRDLRSESDTWRAIEEIQTAPNVFKDSFSYRQKLIELIDL